MIIVYTDDNSVGTAGPKVIRPCPLISISSTPLKNKMANMGSSYTITLNGAILAEGGSPLFSDGGAASVTNNPFFRDSYNPKPTGHKVELQDSLNSIIKKQNALRALFAVEGRRVEILPIRGSEPSLIFYPRLESINFEEGTWTDLCRYTITLSADLMFDNAENIIIDSLAYLNFEPSGVGNDTLYTDQHTKNEYVQKKSLFQFVNDNGGFVEDFSETWSLEPEEGNGNTVNPFNNPMAENLIRSYRLIRNVSATGRTIYGPGPNGIDSIRYEGWEQAKRFIDKRIFADKDGYTTNDSINGYDKYPKLNFDGAFAKGFLNLYQDRFGGYNHSRTENIDKSNGTYSVTDTWLLSSGNAYENYNISLSSSSDRGITAVTIDGTIKGLTTIPSSGSIYNGTPPAHTAFHSPYENAIRKFREVTDSGNFGLISHIYKRAANTIGEFLNPKPVSTSLGANEFTGEITYSISYDTRPLNFISGVLHEKISIQDTYPGDVFVSIPVIGRKNGPVLQYLGTRTEYQRSVNIDLTFGTTYGGTIRQQTILSKPSLNEPARTSLNNLISQLSPAREPGIRKYFLSPPTESWDPLEKRYTINLNWTYELSY